MTIPPTKESVLHPSINSFQYSWPINVPVPSTLIWPDCNIFLAPHLKMSLKIFWHMIILYLHESWFYLLWKFKTTLSGLPWWRSGWEFACQCRGHGFKPWSGKIPHATEQLGPWATITEPAHLEPVLLNKRGCNNERPTHRDEEWPPLAPTREDPCTETKTQHSHK